jgi:uncharacterized protein (TIGR00730 family)
MTTLLFWLAAAVIVLTVIQLLYGLNFRDCRRVIRTCMEFFHAYHILQRVGPSVTFFASARLKPESESYQLLMRCAAKLARRGYSVFHGAGPGGMEAVARGARAGATEFRAALVRANKSIRRLKLPLSIGLAIELPFEQKPNDHCDIAITFRHFFPRKVCLVRYSKAIIIGLGGYGTLDETFEALTLMQCHHSSCVPVYLLDPELAKPLLKLVGELYGKGMISRTDVERLVVVGDFDTCGLPVRRLANEDEMVEEICSNSSTCTVPCDGEAHAEPVVQVVSQGAA